MTVPFKVKAVYEYKSAEPDDLNFKDGQIITVVEDDDEDWYTGEYVADSGDKVTGIFPRNFVEKYEPAIPTRPTRSSRKPAQDITPTSPPQPAHARELDPVSESVSLPAPVVDDTKREKAITEPVPLPESKPSIAKQPPAVAEKPTGNSFRDRIAAFNKPAAAPVTPFKPSGGGSGTGFVKKAFVAPPPSRNAYVPPPTQAPPPQKIYRREEDPEMNQDEEEEVVHDAAVRTEQSATDNQPKPTSLKDRIALLQQQQLEQAAKHAEKKKPKKPPTKRTESADTLEDNAAEGTEAPLVRRNTGDTLGRVSLDAHPFNEDDAPGASETSKAEAAITTPIPQPPRELVSDTNDADDSEAADTEEMHEPSGDEEPQKATSLRSPTQVIGNTDEEVAADDQEDTEDEDPEVRRRRELRERMAKMSGGMGMMGMFGSPGGAPISGKKPKAPKESEHTASAEHEEEAVRAPPIPVMALPGMGVPRRQDTESDEDDAGDDTAAPTPMENKQKGEGEDYVSVPRRTSTEHSLPQSPPGRAVPPPPPRESRPAPPVPSSPPVIPTEPRSPPVRAVPPPPPPTARPAASDADDEVNQTTTIPPGRTSLDRGPSVKSTSSQGPPQAPSNLSINSAEPSVAEKRMSRPPPPPVPGTAPSQPASRPPPPLPPSQPPNRVSTAGALGLASSEQPGDDSDDEVTEYDGDYDTDIASSAKHKDALKSYNRDSSIEDDGALTDDASKMSTATAPRAVPPPPPAAPPREVPPPPPSAPKSRQSAEVPRAAPPPVPTMRPDDEDYDPYRYSSVQHGAVITPVSPPQSPPIRSPDQEVEDSDLYGAPSQPPVPRPPPTRTGGLPPLPSERTAPPPPPPTSREAPLPPPVGAVASAPRPEQPNQSMDISRAATVRRSMDVPRPSADYGFIASDIDLGESVAWWASENTPPPAIQGRTDVSYEVESHTTTKRGGRATVVRDIYVLYPDHSQTTINVSFDPTDPQNATLQQSHERPPPPPRQDQLESAYEQFGSQIAQAAQSVSGSMIGDGSAQAFVLELIRPFQSTALMPVGNRSYGALVYANLANASTQQFDEIRPGDIMTFRNTKFAGHKGGLHAKYSMDVGKPDHVAVVIDWDGTKKKIRAWEQGREEKGKKIKVHDESFRIADLKSGEVRVWRVMPRSWVGWDKS